MVSRLEDSSGDFVASLLEVASKKFTVVVPVFVRVVIEAEDELQAEVQSVVLVKSLEKTIAGSHLKVIAIIAPSCTALPGIEHA